ncbi:hypothetical protein KIPB_001319 [Kipferlia bialata]|uniref:Uncharacterized protein n=1 Tax=Kipferlia bialata TaxID=797122 RepID=A0A9K3CQD2_9EUKA|nr:hypothetical protein KIPB_001319 [Kipferlia bialata]|eukprot:g1319.t1
MHHSVPDALRSLPPNATTVTPIDVSHEALRLGRPVASIGPNMTLWAYNQEGDKLENTLASVGVVTHSLSTQTVTEVSGPIPLPEGMYYGSCLGRVGSTLLLALHKEACVS